MLLRKLLLLFLLLPLFSAAQQTDSAAARRLMMAVHQHYTGTSAQALEFYNISRKDGKITDSLNGVLETWQSCFRMKLGQDEIIDDGMYCYVYNGARKDYFRSKHNTILPLFRNFKPGFILPGANEGLRDLVLYPLNEKQTTDTAHFIVDAETFAIQSILFLKANGDLTQIVINREKYPQDWTTAHFRFEPKTHPIAGCIKDDDDE